MHDVPLVPEKQEVLDRVRAALEYLPDNMSVAAENQPWLALQLNMILDGLTHQDIHIFDLMGCIALLGPTFARVLRKGDPPDGSAHSTALRAV